MPAALDILINDYAVAHGYFYSDWYNMRAHIQNLGDLIEAEDWVSCNTSCESIETWLWNAIQHIQGGTPNLRTEMTQMMTWVSDNWPTVEPPPPLTMHAILEAMYDATPLEYQYFICYVDAYRANMWNLPFYESWHGDLVRHFRP